MTVIVRSQLFENGFGLFIPAKQHAKRTLILSDILESGRKPQSLYKEIASLLRKYPVNRLIGVGEQLSAMSGLFSDSGVKDQVFFTHTEALLDSLATIEFRDETILLKGAFWLERMTSAVTGPTRP
jgi:alanine racemase